MIIEKKETESLITKCAPILVELLLGLGALKRKTIYCKVSEEGKAKATQQGLGGHLSLNSFPLHASKRILFGVLCEGVLNFLTLLLSEFLISIYLIYLKLIIYFD
jgi:hypothetical protein